MVNFNQSRKDLKMFTSELSTAVTGKPLKGEKVSERESCPSFPLIELPMSYSLSALCVVAIYKWVCCIERRERGSVSVTSSSLYHNPTTDQDKRLYNQTQKPPSSVILYLSWVLQIRRKQALNSNQKKQRQTKEKRERAVSKYSLSLPLSLSLYIYIGYIWHINAIQTHTHTHTYIYIYCIYCIYIYISQCNW